MQNLITPVDEGTVVEYIGYDQWSGAAKLASYTCGLLDGQGEVFILTGIPGFHANRRTQGYKWGLEQWCPNVKVIGEQTAEWEREKAVNVATAALQQNPEIDVFYGNSDEMGIGACIAAQKLGRKVNEDIRCISIDGNDVTLDLIEKGQTTATLGVYPKMMGAIVIEQMAKVLDDQEVPYILETPSTIVDINNVADYKSGKTWTEPIKGNPEYDNGLPSGEFAK
jgi:ribose transport system substrate-binding protein